MAKSIHEMTHVYQPDFIPEGEEWRYPHKGGVFCDYIPEGMTAVEFHPTPDGTPKVKLVPGEEPVDEHLETIRGTPDPAPIKSGTKSKPS